MLNPTEAKTVIADWTPLRTRLRKELEKHNPPKEHELA